jgi:hypothetical protein
VGEFFVMEVGGVRIADPYPLPQAPTPNPILKR